MKLRKGDTVIVISGGNSKRSNDKGKVGQILKVNTKDNTVTVQGVNVVVKHKKPTQQNNEGTIETFEAPIDASNVMLYDESTKTRIHVGYAIKDGKKIRINKKTGLEIGKKAPKAKKEKEAPKAEEKVEAKKAPAKKPAAKKEAPAKAPAKKPAAKKTTKKEETK